MNRLLAWTTVSAALLVSVAAHAETWHFDTDKVGKPPRGFSFGRTGQGRQGRWRVRAETDAPSGGNVLAQVDEDGTDYRFPVAVVRKSRLRDVRLSVRCKAVSGKVDQACGLVFRFRNAKNYYVVRANALENNIRFYKVVKGRRLQLASFSGEVTARVWHELKIEAKGAHVDAYWDGKKVLGADDETFSRAGKIGLWTKADTVTYYDDLSTEPLGDTQ